MQIEIVPQSDGTWKWQRIEDDASISAEGEGFDDRAGALAAGREEAGSEQVLVKRSSGSEEQYLTAPTARVVLLNLDGKEVGELDPPAGTSSAPIQVTLNPVGESSQAESLPVKGGKS